MALYQNVHNEVLEVVKRLEGTSSYDVYVELQQRNPPPTRGDVTRAIASLIDTNQVVLTSDYKLRAKA